MDVQSAKAVIVDTQKPNELIEVGLLTPNPPVVSPHDKLLLPSYRLSRSRHRFRDVVCEKCFAQNISRVAEREACGGRLPFRTVRPRLRGGGGHGEGNLAGAREEFRVAVSLLPDAVMVGKAHDEAVADFAQWNKAGRTADRRG